MAGRLNLAPIHAGNYSSFDATRALPTGRLLVGLIGGQLRAVVAPRDAGGDLHVDVKMALTLARRRQRRSTPMKNAYPVRLSTDELRRELAAYLEARQKADKAPGTIDLDKRKVLYFLDWLDDGQLR